MWRQQLFNIAAGISLMLCIGMVPIWILSEDESHGLGACGSHVWHSHLLVGTNRIKLLYGWIAVFNQPEPFFDGIVSMYNSNRPKPQWPPDFYVSFPGLHFRHITWPGGIPGGTDWNVAVSPGYLLALGGVLPMIWAIRRSRARDHRRAGFCLACSYNFTGNASGVCPECGTAAIGVTAKKLSHAESAESAEEYQSLIWGLSSSAFFALSA